MFTIIIGYVATFLIVAAYIPQVIRAYKTKSTEGLTNSFMGMMLVSLVLWITYSILTKDIPLLITNSVSLLQVLFLLYIKIRYK